jgi:hypothetical protein
MKSAARNSSGRPARRLAVKRTAFALFWHVAVVAAWSQTQSPVTFLATAMGRSAEATPSGDYVTIYGKPGRKTYLYQALGALPFRKFQLRVEAAGDRGDERWPNLGIAFKDTSTVLKEITINSAAFQSYDLGVFEAPQNAALYLIFTNDYYNSVTRQDVNLKIRQAVLTPAAQDTVIVRGTQLTLHWNPNREADLKGYRIYHGLVSGKYLNERIEAGPQDTSRVFTVTAGYDYFYALTAYDTAGNESAFSREVMARVRPAAVAATPDLNHDGECDGEDIRAFQRVFGLTCKHARYNPEADFNGDCKIDGQDQTMFLQKHKNCSK